MSDEQAHLKTRPRDPGSFLVRQIEALAGEQARVTLIRERTWASVTFSGTRHRFAIDWNGPASPHLIHNLATTLPKHEFTIPGYFVADILVTERSEMRLLVEALSIIDPVKKSSH